MKVCTRCNKEKDDNLFYKRSDTNRLSGECRQCRSEYGKAYSARNKVKVAANHRANLLKSRYGMTHADFEKLLLLQKGLCAICDKPFGTRRPHIDHDHVTGKVRGLLCYVCNVGIGYLKDSPSIIRKAASYLDKKSDVEIKGFVRLQTRERGKLVEDRAGFNIWTNTGREYLALHQSLDPTALTPTPYRVDNVAYIGVGTGSQVEGTSVLNLVTPVAYAGGTFLAALDPPSFPLTPVRTTVEYHRLFAENEITLSLGSQVDVSELGLFTDGDPTTSRASGPRNTALSVASSQNPLAYKVVEPVKKTDELELEIFWQIRF